MANFITKIIDIMNNLGWFSGFLSVYLESIIPLVPVSVFIALNILTYKFGFIITWIATILGCMTSFYISRRFSHYINKKFKDNKKIKDLRRYIDKISFSNLVILFAIPFTPAFAINIASGISSMKPKKFLIALIIGKLPMIYFWGYIGKSLGESITDITVIAKIIFMVVIAYLVSKVANKFIKE